MFEGRRERLRIATTEEGFKEEEEEEKSTPGGIDTSTSSPGIIYIGLRANLYAHITPVRGIQIKNHVELY